MRRVRVRSHITSRPDYLVCPACGYGELRIRGAFSGSADCNHCGCVFEHSVMRTLQQIVALPDPVGEYPCECGHPEILRLPNGVYHCPGCRSEVLPVSPVLGSSVASPKRPLLAAFARMLLRAGREGEPM